MKLNNLKMKYKKPSKTTKPYLIKFNCFIKKHMN